MKPSPFNGLLVVDKPTGPTSRDVVDRAQRWFPRGTRIGHTGTLDPLATGVLVLCVGAATRLTDYVQRMSKTYRTGLRLGARSDTDDADGVITPVPAAQAPSRDDLAQELHGFVGEIDQVPPVYSAAKVTGRRAYDLARRGESVSLQPRRIRIDAIELLAYEYPRLELEVSCGKGTYIRALARDLGERLGCGALVLTLRRMSVGPFDADQGIGLDADAATAQARLLPLLAAVAELPRGSVDRASSARLGQGQGLPLSQVSLNIAGLNDGQEVAVFADDALAAIAAVDLRQRRLVPVKVLPCS